MRHFLLQPAQFPPRNVVQYVRRIASTVSRRMRVVVRFVNVTRNQVCGLVQSGEVMNIQYFKNYNQFRQIFRVAVPPIIYR